MIMRIVSKVAIIGFFTSMLCGCGGRQERKPSAKPQSITQTEIIAGKESLPVKGKSVGSLQQSTAGSVQNPVRGDVYYEYEPVFPPEEIRKQMVGKWRFHIDSVRSIPILGSPESQLHKIGKDIDIVIGEREGITLVSIPDISGISMSKRVVAPVYEDGDENEDGYASACFADFQIVSFREQTIKLTRDSYISLEGIFISSQQWQGSILDRGIIYYGVAHRVK